MLNNSQPECPECGGPRAMVSWTGGSPPLCHRCAENQSSGDYLGLGSVEGLRENYSAEDVF